MVYNVLIDPKAFDDFINVDKEFAEKAKEAITELAEDPENTGRKSTFPYFPSGYVYEFHSQVNGTRRYYAVFYAFNPTSQTLHVHDVCFRPRD